MPRRDGTDPMGAGSITGRGLGLCTGVNSVKCGAGLGMGSGFGLACRRGFSRGIRSNRRTLWLFLIRMEVINYGKTDEVEKSLLPA